MDRLVPFLLLALGLGAVHLGIGGLVRLRPNRPEFWVFGLGVRTKLGAIKVLIVALALCFLAYSLHKKGSIQKILEVSEPPSNNQAEERALQLQQALKIIDENKTQLESLTREKEECQKIVSNQGVGLASRSDVAAELQSSLGSRHKENAALQATLNQTRGELRALKADYEQISQSYNQLKGTIPQLESQIDVLQNEKVSLNLKLENSSKQSESEIQRVKEEMGRYKAFAKDQERRASLLRQGLVLREANDWSLDQEIQRLANLLSSQTEVNNPRQTDISRSIQKINQVLREGQALTKQAKVADSKPADSPQDKTVSVPEKKK